MANKAGIQLAAIGAFVFLATFAVSLIVVQSLSQSSPQPHKVADTPTSSDTRPPSVAPFDRGNLMTLPSPISQPQAMGSLERFYQRVEEVDSRARREGYTPQVVSEFLALLREGSSLSGADNLDLRERVLVSHENSRIAIALRYRKAPPEPMTTVECSNIKTKVIHGLHDDLGYTRFSIIATLENLGPTDRLCVMLEAMDNAGQILKVLDLEGVCPIGEKRILTSTEEMKAGLFHRISRWEAFRVSHASTAPTYTVSGIVARVLVPESDQTELVFFSVSAAVKNNGPEESVWIQVQAIDAEGFALGEESILGQVPVGTTQTVTTMTGAMNPGDFRMIRCWKPKD